MRFTVSVVAAALAGVGGAAHAADEIPTVDLEPFAVMHAPASLGKDRAAASAAASASAEKSKAVSAPLIEKPAALNGSLFAVVAPTYNGPTVSYIRLVNAGFASTTFNVHFVGAQTSTDYGTAAIQVPKNASKQLPITPVGGSNSVQTLANANPSPTDTSFALFIENFDMTAGYQHVTYNGNNGFFENASLCRYMLNETLNSVGTTTLVLPNVHTSGFSANYPSTVSLYNYWNTAVTYLITVTDAATGTTLGQYNAQTQPNSYYNLPVSTIETNAHVTVSSSIPHYNILVTDSSSPGLNPPAILGSWVDNKAVSGSPLVNMGMVCAVNAPQQSMGGIGGGGAGW